MATSDNKKLTEIDPDLVDKNPVNPRLIFREAEMNPLLDSIREVGIQVPLSVFSSGTRYVLLDGERRWRCAKKLNLQKIPVLMQPEPPPLENLLTMFNIHNVRSDWDLMPMALKLRDVQEMVSAGGQATTAKALSGLTGVPAPTVRRALELLELPQHYQDELLAEAEKPRDQQRITADVFVEVNKSRRVIERYQPEVFDEITETQFVDSMVDKYRSGVVNNVVWFRDVSKIARAELAGGDSRDAAPALVRLVEDKTYTIEDAYQASVESAYVVRDLETRVSGLTERLTDVDRRRTIPEELRKSLTELRRVIGEVLGTG